MPDKLLANSDILRRIFYLRSVLLIVGILVVMVLIVEFNYVFPHGVVISCLLLMAAFNAWVLFRLSRTDLPVQENELFLNLTFDVVLLAIILFFTGGATNPFITMFIIPIIISVTILPRRFAWWLVGISAVLYSLLMFYYLPIGMDMDHQQNEADDLSGHFAGMWLAFVISAGVAAQFVYSMGETLRRQQHMLARARERDLRDQKLLTLGTLAASTAHEMGTPLGSMRLLVSEISNELHSAPEQVRKDLVSLHRQVDRCSQALADLSAAAGQVHLSRGHVVPVSEFLKELYSEWQTQHVDVTMRCDWHIETIAHQSILSDQSLRHAILNILNNAAEASRQDLLWEASSGNNTIIIRICDRGSGLTEEMRQMVGKHPVSTKDAGMGLGLFLAFAIIERFNGKLSMVPREGGGLCTAIELPLQVE